MHRIHLKRNLRTLAYLVIIGAIVSALSTLWWANHTGLPDSWRTGIENAFGNQGAHITIGSLSYRPLRGIVASNVRVFSDPDQKHEISRLESIELSIDKTKLARGKVHLNKIQLRNAKLTLPMDPANPESEKLEVTDANGTLFMPGDQRFELRNARGNIKGIQVVLNAKLIGYRDTGEPPSEDDQYGKRRSLLAAILKELSNWRFSGETPPSMFINLEGDANDWSSFRSKIRFNARDMEKNNHVLRTVEADAELHGPVVTITRLEASDSRGSLAARVDYDVWGRDGRFDLHSTLNIPSLLKAWFGLPPLRGVIIGGKQQISAAGEFHLQQDAPPDIRLTGSAHCESVLLKSIQFDTITTLFSWHAGDLYLRDLHLDHKDGQATGKVMIQWPLVRVAVQTNLPADVVGPVFEGQPLERILADFSENPGAETFLDLEGGFNAEVRTSWAYTGIARVKNHSYRGVPVNLATCTMSLNTHELDFTDGTVIFNYDDYPLQNAYGGPRQATTKVGRIRYDAANKAVEVDNVRGDFWPAPLIRLFAAKTADELEKYRFHRPPSLQGSGIVDVTPEGRTTLDIRFSSDHPADYEFLGETITLNQPSGIVALRGSRVTADQLKMEAFGGPVTAHFDHRSPGRLKGEITWTKVSLPAVASTYGFALDGGGLATGRLEFTLQDNKIETMDGNGLLAIERTELFSFPTFGPLSALIGGVLNDKNAAVERATDAFCNLTIENGILSTTDFQTATNNLTFVGDGSVDMTDLTFDMTMRMNARGLLGLLTIPLRPLYGMFQFNGTGHLKKPKWEKALFTTPTPRQKELLMTAPKATIIEE
ncbi:MAG: hypothetical protein ACQCXQ_09835 [Verrucomicrobiales bacterium]|nr:AsmA-like C-terminal region-containing protein [Verrucomicrobiota bacterium JB025]